MMRTILAIFLSFLGITQSPTVITPVNSVLSTPTVVEDQKWTLLLTGDIIPARVVNQKMVQMQDFTWPFKEISAVLQNAELTLANLEAPLVTQCPVTNEGFKFCGEATFASSMKQAGIDIVNLANNHSLNYGSEALEETKRHLQEQGIAWTGFGTPTILTVNKTKIGFLGYNGVGQIFEEEKIRPEIETLKKQVDFLIVSVHWGKEYERQPVPDASLAPDDPKVWGKKFVDWGADLVAGNHPHWYQGIEWYNGKLIIYAQGNTIFDQEWSTETKRGYLAKLTMDKNIISPTIEFFPIGIHDWGQAYLLEGKEKEEILQFLSL